ncbi:hypothetical protein [Rudaea sp.]|uniref:hypothetical protein n=1 Tax=Rudaea sp. TaxID=2136325 RepID=UPI003220858F
MKPTRAKGLQADPIFKLGKAPARKDPRNFKFAALLRAPPALPVEYDFDVKHPGIPTPMFGNDVHGDCVIAGRAHQTLRFEDVEQKKIIAISDSDVLNEYFNETGGPDSGLVVLDSLNEWRKGGWLVGRKRYYIKAYSEITPRSQNATRQAIFLDVGVGLGLQMPISAQAQTRAGKPWDVVSGSGSRPGSWGGHYVFVPGYTKLGPVCVTWGRKQQMTWAFYAKYCDEAYAIFDATDSTKLKRAIDVKKLGAMLQTVTSVAKARR